MQKPKYLCVCHKGFDFYMADGKKHCPLFGYSKCTLSFMDERMGLMIQVLNLDIIVDFKYVVFFKIKSTKWFSVMIYFSINEKGINHYDEVLIYDTGNQIQMID